MQDFDGDDEERGFKIEPRRRPIARILVGFIVRLLASSVSNTIVVSVRCDRWVVVLLFGRCICWCVAHGDVCDGVEHDVYDGVEHDVCNGVDIGAVDFESVDSNSRERRTLQRSHWDANKVRRSHAVGDHERSHSRTWCDGNQSNDRRGARQDHWRRYVVAATCQRCYVRCCWACCYDRCCGHAQPYWRLQLAKHFRCVHVYIVVCCEYM